MPPIKKIKQKESSNIYQSNAKKCRQKRVSKRSSINLSIKVSSDSIKHSMVTRSMAKLLITNKNSSNEAQFSFVNERRHVLKKKKNSSNKCGNNKNVEKKETKSELATVSKEFIKDVNTIENNFIVPVFKSFDSPQIKSKNIHSVSTKLLNLSEETVEMPLCAKKFNDVAKELTPNKLVIEAKNEESTEKRSINNENKLKKENTSERKNYFSIKTNPAFSQEISEPIGKLVGADSNLQEGVQPKQNQETNYIVKCPQNSEQVCILNNESISKDKINNTFCSPNCDIAAISQSAIDKSNSGINDCSKLPVNAEQFNTSVKKNLKKKKNENMQTEKPLDAQPEAISKSNENDSKLCTDTEQITTSKQRKSSKKKKSDSLVNDLQIDIHTEETSKPTEDNFKLSSNSERLQKSKEKNSPKTRPKDAPETAVITPADKEVITKPLDEIGKVSMNTEKWCMIKKRKVSTKRKNDSIDIELSPKVEHTEIINERNDIFSEQSPNIEQTSTSKQEESSKTVKTYFKETNFFPEVHTETTREDTLEKSTVNESANNEQLNNVEQQHTSSVLQNDFAKIDFFPLANIKTTNKAAEDFKLSANIDQTNISKQKKNSKKRKKDSMESHFSPVDHIDAANKTVDNSGGLNKISKSSNISSGFNKNNSNPHISSDFIFTPQKESKKKGRKRKKIIVENRINFTSPDDSGFDKKNELSSLNSMQLKNNSEINEDFENNKHTEGTSKNLNETSKLECKEKSNESFTLNNSDFLSSPQKQEQTVEKSTKSKFYASDEIIKELLRKNKEKSKSSLLNIKDSVDEVFSTNSDENEINNNFTNMVGKKYDPKQMQLLKISENSAELANKDTPALSYERKQTKNVQRIVRQELWKKKQLYNLQKNVVTMENNKLDIFKNIFSSVCTNLFNKSKEDK